MAKPTIESPKEATLTLHNYANLIGALTWLTVLLRKLLELEELSRLMISSWEW